MARIRNVLDVIIERMYAPASVADQLSFNSWPEEARGIARRAIALEIDKEAEGGSDADAELTNAVEAVRLHAGELRSYIEKFSGLVDVRLSTSDIEVNRGKMLAELAELHDAIGELEVAAVAEPT